jgi:hypothetical protein
MLNVIVAETAETTETAASVPARGHAVKAPDKATGAGKPETAALEPVLGPVVKAVSAPTVEPAPVPVMKAAAVLAIPGKAALEPEYPADFGPPCGMDDTHPFFWKRMTLSREWSRNEFVRGMQALLVGATRPTRPDEVMRCLQDVLPLFNRRQQVHNDLYVWPCGWCSQFDVCCACGDKLGLRRLASSYDDRNDAEARAARLCAALYRCATNFWYATAGPCTEHTGNVQDKCLLAMQQLLLEDPDASKACSAAQEAWHTLGL